MGFSAAVMKLIFLFNLIFLGIGAFLIYTGISGQSLPNNLDHFGEFVNQVSFANKVILSVGVVIFLISFFGCWGTFVESTSFLSMYAILLVILIALETFVAFYLFFYEQNVKSNAEGILKQALTDYDKNEASKEFFNEIQKDWECCGLQGPTDWTHEIPPHVVPQSCCKSQTEKCDVSNSFQKGCVPVFLDKADHLRTFIFWIIAVVVVFKILLVSLTLTVRNHIRNSQRMVI